MPNMQPIRAIHPRPHLTSLAWVKASLLYWEGILRVVPEGFALQDSPEICDLARAGLIEDVSPVPYMEAAREQVLRSLPKLECLRAANVVPHDGPATARRRGGYTVVRSGELDPALLEALRAYRLAATAGDWVILSSEIADLYMSALSAEIGRHLHAAPTVDPETQDARAPYPAHWRLVADPAAQVPLDGYACARRVSPFPALEAARVPTPTLLRVRQKRRDERHAFRDYVQARTAAIAQLPSEAVGSHIADFVHELEAEISRQRSSQRGTILGDAAKLAPVVAPVTAGAAASAAGAPDLLTAVGAAGSVIAGVTERVRARSGTRPVIAYLMSLDKLLGFVAPWR